MRIFFSLIIIFTYLISSEPISPLPIEVEYDVKKAKLGKKLFFDTILSKDDTIACVSCHIIKAGGDDNVKVSTGNYGQKGDMISPTVLNSRYNFVQFWDGRAKDLKEQAMGPVENPKEMGNTFDNLIKTLNNTPYKDEFDKIYSDGITKENIADAIAEYEKSLVTPNSPFDRYLRGDISAITPKQKEGYELFKSKGCIACHHGINIGGNMYAKFGNMIKAESRWYGRYNVTKHESDKYVFKVPTLRNINETAPYLHDGRYDKLEDVVNFMLNYQLAKDANKDEIDKIVAFLKSLSAEYIDYVK
jgi:cytochrome c peroxidase